MVDLDLKDRKILYELDLNCRQSNAQIGKKVGLSKEVVTYRIQRMEKAGIITNYWTAVDTYRLGYQVFRAYINFQDITKDVKDKIIQYFVNCRDTWGVISMKGDFDFDVLFWVKDVGNFYQYWNRTLEHFGQYFGTTTISTLNQVIAYKKSFLISDEDSDNNEFYQITAGGQPHQIDLLDYKLLDAIVANARIRFIDLAEKLHCSSQNVRYRLDNLMKKGIIRAFRINIDYSKLGLQKFCITIYLRDHSKRKSILNYLHRKPYMEDVDNAIGWGDVQFELIVHNLDELLKVMNEIDSQFPNSIRRQTFIIPEKDHKNRWLPEGFEREKYR